MSALGYRHRVIHYFYITDQLPREIGQFSISYSYKSFADFSVFDRELVFSKILFFGFLGNVSCSMGGTVSFSLSENLEAMKAPRAPIPTPTSPAMRANLGPLP